MVLLSMTLVSIRLLEADPLGSANDRSRWCTVWSLVERGTYQIDEIRKSPGWDTIDLVRHDGHFYSTKPPLLPRLVAGLYSAVRRTLGWTLTDHLHETTRLILFLINILPMGLALWLLCRLIIRYSTTVGGSVILIVATCWATLLNPFLTVFNNHTVAITFLVYSLYLAMSITIEQQRGWWRFALCGLCAMFTCCNELPAAAYGLALFVILLRTDPRRTLLVFVPAALIPLAGFFITNYHATGGWKPFYMYYGTEKYVFVHEGIPSYWAEPQGIDQAKDSPLQYLLHCTIGHHGVLSLTPIFLITLVGWCLPRCWRESRLRMWHALGLILTLIVFAFYLSKTENYNYGGVSVALRWVLWLTPFWLLAMLPALNTWGDRRWLQLLVIPLMAVSLVSAWYPRKAPWTQPWLFALMEDAKWINYSTPRPQFDRPPMSWIGSLPAGATTDEDYWIRYVSLDAEGRELAIELRDAGPLEKDGRAFRQVDVRELIDGALTRSRQLLFDVEKFQQGAAVTAFLSLPDDGDELDAARQFVQGLPRAHEYYSSRIRYTRTALRRDAFRSHIGYSYVTVKDASGTSARYVRDVWFCDEVPFGTLQFEDRVIRSGQGEVSRRVWTVQQVGRLLSSGQE